MSQRHWIQNEAIMLITTNTLKRVRVFADPTKAREAVECLYRVQVLHPFFLYGFVMMPDHIHLLLQMPEGSAVSQMMSAYKSGLTFDIGTPKLWQRRFHQRIVEYPPGALEYIHFNPVKAGLVEEPHYQWSSASGLWDVTPLPMSL